MGSNVFVVVFDFFGKFEVFLASAEKKKNPHSNVHLQVSFDSFNLVL